MAQEWGAAGMRSLHACVSYQAIRDLLPNVAGCKESPTGHEDELGDNFQGEKSLLSLENTLFWQFFSYPNAT
jgi:hypothetical protein